MYCVKCGVQLADTEKKCPLCSTVVYHPEITRESERELYPSGKMPRYGSGRAVLCGAVIILFMIPLLLTFFSDILFDGEIDWFGYALGGLAITYLTFALPMWFENPNPVIFVSCDFIGYTLYLLYINLATGGDWFLSFAFPVCIGVAVIVCTLITLMRYLRRGRLYAIGGSLVAFGALILMIELLLGVTFKLSFIGWSTYPLVTFVLVGGLIIYLAASSTAREKIERKLFF